MPMNATPSTHPAAARPLLSPELPPAPAALRQAITDAWLKDGIHFDKRLGARIMSSLWGRGVDQALPKDDAVKLTTTSVDRYLADTNLLRLSFLDRDIEMISYYNNKLGID